MVRRALEFLRSEEGDVIEWIVAALIVGVGSIPVVAGIAQALLDASARGEERVRSVVWTGY